MIIPDGIEPVVAFRCWYLGERGNLLSMNHTMWPVREKMEAKCEKTVTTVAGFRGTKTVVIDLSGAESHAQDEHVPGEDCSCGIYAANTIDHALQYFQGPTSVIGELYMWGKIIEGDRGWRAQYAYPKSLYFQSLQPSILDFFGMDRDFPSYVAWQEYERKREEKIKNIEIPFMLDYGVELKPLSMKEITGLKL